MKNIFGLCLLLTLALIYSCSDPILTGSDFNDDIGLVTDTTNLKLKTVKADSLVTFIELASGNDHSQSRYTTAGGHS